MEDLKSALATLEHMKKDARWHQTNADTMLGERLKPIFDHLFEEKKDGKEKLFWLVTPAKTYWVRDVFDFSSASALSWLVEKKLVLEVGIENSEKNAVPTKWETAPGSFLTCLGVDSRGPVHSIKKPRMDETTDPSIMGANILELAQVVRPILIVEKLALLEALLQEGERKGIVPAGTTVEIWKNPPRGLFG